MAIESIILLLIAFGGLVVLPIVIVFARHQRRMTELIHKRHQPLQNDEVHARLDAMQRELEAVRNRQNEAAVQRQEQSPASTPKVEDRLQD